MDQISCPVCNRDYELPRRHMKTFEDFDFLPIPRILPCLHTVCHSCLETQRESNDIGQICCPICRKEDVVKGIRYMPLDITTLKQIANMNSTELMSMCCKCYEDVPSVSWCDSCSSALCEFHYTDHKLSYDTSKHNVNTIKEITCNNLPIEFKFPPISCPEALMCDCTLYCHDCMHLISSDAFISNHKNHKVTSYAETVAPMKESINKTIDQAKRDNIMLERNIEDIRETLESLDMYEENCTNHITKTFTKIQKLLKKREKELLIKLKSSVEVKRTILVDQLSSFTETFEDSKHVLQTCDLLLKNTRDHQFDAMYMIAATETIEYRGGDINEIAAEKCKTRLKVNPEMKTEFIEYELHSISNIINTLGAVTFDNESMPPTPPIFEHSKGASYPKISFSLKVDDRAVSNAESRRHLIGSGGEYLTIEARLLPNSQADLSSVDCSSDDKLKGKSNVAPNITTTEGELLGSIELHVNIDRRLLAGSRHTFNSYFESCLVNKLPTVRISKELVALSTSM